MESAHEIYLEINKIKIMGS